MGKRGRAPSGERRRDQSPPSRVLRRAGPARWAAPCSPHSGRTEPGGGVDAGSFRPPAAPAGRRIYGARRNKAAEGEAGESWGRAPGETPRSGPQAGLRRSGARTRCSAPVCFPRSTARTLNGVCVEGGGRRSSLKLFVAERGGGEGRKHTVILIRLCFRCIPVPLECLLGKGSTHCLSRTHFTLALKKNTYIVSFIAQPPLTRTLKCKGLPECFQGLVSVLCSTEKHMRNTAITASRYIH